MNGSKTDDMTRANVLAAVRAIPREKDFVWDGIDEDDRPLTEQELQSGLALAHSRGRPSESDKTQITMS